VPDPTTSTELEPEDEQPSIDGITKLIWEGDIAAQKWVNFYMKVLAKFASSHDLQLGLHVEITGNGAISPQKVEEMKAALRELGLDTNVVVR
jgi:hypothetical protein